MAAGNFSVFDYVIFALMLAISAGIGIFYGCFGSKNSTAKEVLVANRQMGVFPTAMSLLASFMSGITILGNPAETYNYGTMFWWSGVAYTMAIVASAYIFMPLFHNLEITSIYEYLERRFDKWVKLMASILFSFQMTIYMALVLYAPAVALNQVTGLNTWISVVSIGVVCTFYTTIGGMKAVMWTDVFQIIMMFIGLLAALIKGTIDQGGVRKVLEINLKYDRIDFFEINPNPTTRHTVWGLTIGSFFQWLFIYGVNQSQVQRYLSVPSVKAARKALFWNLIGLLAILSISLSVGLVIFAKYYQCDPILSKRIDSSEQLFPLFVMETLQTTIGLPGLFLACLFSAALSTISSGLNSLAAVVLEDIIKGFFVKDMSDKRATRLSKILCIVFGLACLALTVVASQLGALLQAALSLFGVLGGPILGLFCLGIFVPFSNSKGAITGTICGLFFTIWIFSGFIAYGVKYPKKQLTAWCNSTQEFDSNFLTSTQMPYRYVSTYEKFHSISYTWYGLLAVTVTMTTGSIVSLLTGGAKKDLDFTLMVPVFNKVAKILPYTWQKKLNCFPLSASIEPQYEQTNKIELETVTSEVNSNGHSNLAFVNSSPKITKF